MANEIARIEFTEDQVGLIKKQFAPSATDAELQLFLYQCRQTGLNPMTRQIYCIHRAGKMTVQTSIDGFRVIAERSGVYAGQDEPEFTEDEKGNIIKCKVTVYKFSANGQRYPAAVGVAYWSEYAQQSPMWTKMKHTMLAKCAEALALRKAFPQDLSGLYTSDEMQQADAGYTTASLVDEREAQYQNAEPAKKITIKEAKGQAEEIKAAITDLLDCNTITDLKTLKSQLPDYVKRNESFKEAATQRFNQLQEAIMEDIAANDGN